MLDMKNLILLGVLLGSCIATTAISGVPVGQTQQEINSLLEAASINDKAHQYEIQRLKKQQDEEQQKIDEDRRLNQEPQLSPE